MKVLLRLGFLMIGFVLVAVALAFVALTFLPAFVLAGERGVDWVMDWVDRIMTVPLGPFGRSMDV